MSEEHYPFRVSIWLDQDTPLLSPPLPRWEEMCLCEREWKATAIAESLASHYKAVQVAEFLEGRYIAYHWIPNNPEPPVRKEDSD